MSCIDENEKIKSFLSPQVIGRGRLQSGQSPGTTARCAGKRTGRGTGSAPQAGEQSERGPRHEGRGGPADGSGRQHERSEAAAWSVPPSPRRGPSAMIH